MDPTHLAGMVIAMKRTSSLRPAPAQLVLICAGTVCAFAVLMIALANLWFAVGRPVENRTGSLLLGLAAAGVTLDAMVLAVALLAGGIHRAFRLRRRRA